MHLKILETGITDIGIISGDVYPQKVQEVYGDSKFAVKITIHLLG
jgi:dTDP-glucose pyrophosphorylase